jgi:hypothetical protein
MTDEQDQFTAELAEKAYKNLPVIASDADYAAFILGYQIGYTESLGVSK